MPQANIDMGLIQEAIKRRAQGGGGTPVTSQLTMPRGTNPGGGMNTPMKPPVMSMPQGGQASLPPRQDAQGAAKAATQADSPAFDDETRKFAKALVSRLVKVL